MALYPDPRKVGNWIQTELFRLQKESGEDEATVTLPTPEHLADLLTLDRRRHDQPVGGQASLRGDVPNRAGAGDVVEALGLAQVSDTDELRRIVDEVIAANPKPVEDYRGGKTSAAGRLVGEVMKATRGRANPGVVNELLRSRLDAS